VPAIACCMIVKDAIDTLERVIGAVRLFVAEVCVYENGSTDGTLELARSWPGRVWDDRPPFPKGMTVNSSNRLDRSIRRRRGRCPNQPVTGRPHKNQPRRGRHNKKQPVTGRRHENQPVAVLSAAIVRMPMCSR